MVSVIFKYICFVLIDIASMIFFYLPAAIIIPLFYRAQEEGKDNYTWGWIFGTFDNPPQGDKRWVERGSFFPGVTTGFRGYLNRVGWMLRNPLYGLAKKLSLWWEDGYRIESEGNPDISDKYRIAGTYKSKLYDQQGKVIAFEYYTIKPWSKTRCLRMRLGWKIKSRKVQETGIMQFVFTVNPLDGLGDE